MDTAYFGGGCFWCTDAVFKRIKGVKSVIPGYAGGKTENPEYRDVCSGLTGHAELVKIEFDPELVSFRELLLVFFSTHDPTTLNRQGNDVGSQYRSIIFYTDEDQKQMAEKFIKNEAGEIWSDTIVTELTPLKQFYPAEDYHHDYYVRNSARAYCQIVIRPKVDKLKKEFQNLLAHE